MNKGMCWLHKIAWLLLAIGGLNWGLIAIDPSYNVVAWLLGDPSMMMTSSRIVYGLVGLSTLASLMAAKCCGGCKMCDGGKCAVHGA